MQRRVCAVFGALLLSVLAVAMAQASLPSTDSPNAATVTAATLTGGMRTQLGSANVPFGALAIGSNHVSRSRRRRAARAHVGQHAAKARVLRAVCAELEQMVSARAAAATRDGQDAPPSGGGHVFDSFCHGRYRYVITRSPDGRPAERGALSERERIVARLATRGDALKVIANTCSISLQAVSTYLKRAKQKLGVASQSDLVWAMMCEEGGPSSPMSGYRLIAQLAVGGDWFRIFRGQATADRDIGSLLTTAEAEILERLLRGLRTSEIARDRGTTAATVATQISTIMRKVNVSSRSELVAAALAGWRSSDHAALAAVTAGGTEVAISDRRAVRLRREASTMAAAMMTTLTSCDVEKSNGILTGT
jgi:DNA-binding NarL/FixJ family response regulator